MQNFRIFTSILLNLQSRKLTFDHQPQRVCKLNLTYKIRSWVSKTFESVRSFQFSPFAIGSMHFTVSVFQSLLGKSRKTHFSGKLWTLAFDGSFQRILWIQDANWTCKRRSGDVLFTSRFQGRTTAVNYNKTDFSEMKTHKYSLTLQQ